ncbi:MAG: hypothetical protein GDA48_08950 [Hormoscilla sp. GM102CHS1]|nr:hypothetical protein [Hormoscilla sp. GM102CHS1]
MANKQIKIPYMDFFLEAFDKGDSEVIESFGRHAHWGYWEAPTEANGSVEDFAKATEDMCRKVYVAANVGDGQSVLDVGCGFGGAIASINEGFKNMKLVG